jgi:ABC-2 type transport system ATP-binding protein
VLIHSKDSDAVARYLLTQTVAHDVEIESRGIEDAFLALTADDDPAAAEYDTDSRSDKEEPS